jgi:hypothetical protein
MFDVGKILNCYLKEMKYTQPYGIIIKQIVYDEYQWYSLLAKSKAVPQHTCGGTGGRGCIGPTHS